jgi:hypothetical protein
MRENSLWRTKSQKKRKWELGQCMLVLAEITKFHGTDYDAMRVLFWCRLVLQFHAFRRSVRQEENSEAYNLQCVAACYAWTRSHGRPYQGCALTT